MSGPDAASELLCDKSSMANDGGCLACVSVHVHVCAFIL